MGKKNLTVGELIRTEFFKNKVSQEISALVIRKKTRPVPKKGLRYRRDYFDRMGGENKLNTEFFLENIESIWEKKSSLNMEGRLLIKGICDQALILTLQEQQRLENLEENKKQKTIE